MTERERFFWLSPVLTRTKYGRGHGLSGLVSDEPAMYRRMRVRRFIFSRCRGVNDQSQLNPLVNSDQDCGVYQ